MSIVYGNMLLLFFVLLEIAVMRFSSKKVIPWKEIIVNLQSGHIPLWIMRSLSLVGYDFILQNLSLSILNQLPMAVQWVIAFVTWDFCFYWSHRFHHSIKLLWAVHGVHHEGEDFNLSLGIRNSWYSSITSYPFYSVMAFSGIPLDIFITVSGVHFFIQFYNHNHFVKKSGWLEYILITPSHHRVHHGKNDEYVDKNFGGTFVLWDKLFHTFQIEKKDTPVIFGVNDPVDSCNPIFINNRRFFKKNQLPEKKEQAVILTSQSSIFISATASLLLLFFLLYFIWQEAFLDSYQKLILFLLIFLATVANGSILDGKKWGLLVWCIVSLPLNIASFLTLNQDSRLYLLIVTLLGMHGLITFYLYARKLKGSSKKSELNQLL